MAKPLSSNITDIDDGKQISVEGDVDYSCSNEMRVSIQEALAGDPARLVIDLAGVDYMDSSGVATLVEALQIQTKNNRKLVLCNLQQRVQGIFEISRLTTVFTIVADTKAARSA